MSNYDQKQGTADANSNKGPKNPNEFKSAQERNDYNAAYNQAKEQQNRK